MNAFGLTGNIGCGKSTVASLLSQYPEVLILDCDRIAKEIISGNTHRKEIAEILGTNVIDIFPGGNTDFAAIAAIIFKQPKKKRLFEGLIHPLVWATVEERVGAAAAGTMSIVESAIIYETSSEHLFTAVIVASCNPEEQFRRLRQDRGMTDDKIRARLAQQLPSAKKENEAEFVINTDCSLKKLARRVENLYHILKQQKGI